MVNISKEDIPTISEALKEKYKNAENLNYNADIWAARESKDNSITVQKSVDEYFQTFQNHKTTTGNNFDGYEITNYITVISGNVVLGTGFFSEWMAEIDDYMGTTSSPFEKKIEKAKNLALNKLITKSVSIG